MEYGRGEFDHIVWVTMKRSGPVFANILLDAIVAEDLQAPEAEEPAAARAKPQPVDPVRGQVFFEGSPTPQAYVVSQKIDGQERHSVRADALVEADVSFTLSTYTAYAGAPAGEYTATMVWRKPFVDAAGKPGTNMLPARYARAETSGLRFTVKPGAIDFVLGLRK